MTLQFRTNPGPYSTPVSFPPLSDLYRTVAPTNYLATLDELKAWAVIEDDSADTRLTMALAAASDGVERETANMWRSQTWVQTFNRWDNCYYLDLRPTSVVVKYYDSNNALQTVASTNYYYLLSTPKIIFDQNYTFPSHYARPDAIQVSLVQNDVTVDSLAKVLTCAIANELNENRETTVDGIINENPAYTRMTRLLRRGLIA